ncbi:MAG: hypothetical protein PHU23_05435 [Dehalococcoidales bacterium]|nr:hypothetical protein [Dehalococcoidales bacterium]
MKDKVRVLENLNLGDNCCCGHSIPGSRKISFPDGSQVALIGLDEVMEELLREGKPVDNTTALEIFNRLKRNNYISSSAQKLYLECLLTEYQRFCDKKITS